MEYACGLNALGVATLGLALAGAASARAQALPSAPSAVVRPLQLTAGVMLPLEQPGVVSLTLDEAIATALKDSPSIAIRSQQERLVRGEILTVGNALLPNLTASAYTQAQEINLAAMGFKPGTISVPGFNSSGFATIVKVNTTDAQINLSQQLFNVPAYFLYRAAQKAADSAGWETLNTRGGVVLATGGFYLQVLADQAQVRNAAALVQQDRAVFDNARARHDAGVGINLDVLRAQVQLQNEQQELVRAENAVAKDKIELNRAMGQPAGQALDLVDTAPFAEFSEMPLEDALRLAYERRKDLRGLESQLEVAERAKLAVRYERLPTLGVNGFYGVLGETTGLYHGVFVAEGRLSVPVFQEALLRGQKAVAQSQVDALQHQIDARKADVEAQIRSSVLDVESAAELVKVARNNVELSTQALSDAIDRFKAGVDDDLPVVRAQATLAGAQTSVVQAEFQYNYSKLVLARNTGVVETEYRQYLGR